MILQFGKYKGQNLESIFSIDKNYLIWLACNSWVVRREAQDIFTKMSNSEVSKLASLGYEVLSQKSDSDLNYETVLKIGFEKYVVKTREKIDFNFPISLEYKQMFFTNQYEKSGKWKSAIFNNIKPFIVIK
jgi:hypothetical protein